MCVYVCVCACSTELKASNWFGIRERIRIFLSAKDKTSLPFPSLPSVFGNGTDMNSNTRIFAPPSPRSRKEIKASQLRWIEKKEGGQG